MVLLGGVALPLRLLSGLRGANRPVGTAEIEEFSCADDVSLQDALPPIEDPTVVGVYFSCGADSPVLGTNQQPVYLAIREVPAELSETTQERLEAAVRE